MRCSSHGGDKAAQELRPERSISVSASPNVQADDLAAAGLVDGVGDHDALPGDAASGADRLRSSRQRTRTGSGASQQALAERLHLLIEQAGDAAGLAAADP
jgi:hypothetical protein